MNNNKAVKVILRLVHGYHSLGLQKSQDPRIIFQDRHKPAMSKLIFGTFKRLKSVQFLCYFFATCDSDEHILQYAIILYLWLVTVVCLWKGLSMASNMPHKYTVQYTHTHTRLIAPFPGLPGWAGTRKVKPIWILLKQETVNGSGISWAICKSAPCSRQITTPAPHHSVFYRPDALPAAQPTASKHWRPQYTVQYDQSNYETTTNIIRWIQNRITS